MVIKEIREKLQQPRYAKTTMLFRRSLAKEQLIPYLLRFIYKHRDYRRLVFYGGTCAHVIYGLERLSEDIDLHNPGVDLGMMGKDLEEYIGSELGISKGTVYKQKGEGGVMRWVVRLPIMYDLGLSPNKNEKLHLKLEISQHSQIYGEQISPVVTNGLAMVVRHFDETSLMAGKISACLKRVKMRGDKLSVKGRDWYDLWWWLKRGVEPNWKKLETEVGLRNWVELGERIKKKLDDLDLKEVELDLLPFWEDGEYVKVWVRNMRSDILRLMVIN